MTVRLAVHLQASGSMLWTRVGLTYSCDLGLGGAQFDVGTAMQIWDLAATIAAASLTQARAADVTAMRQALRSEFDLADANWQQWTP